MGRRCDRRRGPAAETRGPPRAWKGARDMTEGSTLWGRAVEAEPRGAALTAARSSRPAHAGWRKPILGLLAVGLFTLTPLLAAACGGSTAATTLTVFAASSLTDAFTKLGADYTAAHPGVKVVFNFTGSQDLVAQIQQGAPADVFASADPTSMAAVSGQVGAPTVFAGNQLEIVVAPGNPKGIRTLADLADPGPKVCLLYTSDAADEEDSVDLGGRRIIKKK